MMNHAGRLGLRARVTVASAVLSLVVAASVSFASYQLVRSELVHSREDAATARAQINARAVRNALLASNPGGREFLATLSGDSESVVLAQIDGEWFSGSVGASPDDVPLALRDLVDGGRSGHQRARISGDPYVAVGIPLPAVDAGYFELTPLREVDDTLTSLARRLTIAAAVAALAGGAIGWYTSRRVLRPLRRLNTAAEQISAGHYETRLPSVDDADLGPLVRSFNTMAGSVQDRIAREVRFTADAAHELRSPIASMLAAVWIARRRQGGDPEAAEEALERLEVQAEEFRDVVLDLLELARAEGPGAEAAREPVDVRQLVSSVVARSEVPPAVRIDESVPDTFPLDRRRIGQVLINLLENAQRHGGGATLVDAHMADGTLVIGVEDEGPGVPEHERSYVFDRFARGERATRSEQSGSGLGLALVAEHVRLHGGRVHVTDGEKGGARFVIELPPEPR
jgi:signal transduction histidine kinase